MIKTSTTRLRNMLSKVEVLIKVSELFIHLHVHRKYDVHDTFERTILNIFCFAVSLFISCYSRAIFTEDMREVLKHNLEYDLGQHTYTLGMNEFSDMVRDMHRSQHTRKSR